MAINEASARYELPDVLKLLEESKAQLFILQGEEILGAAVTTIENSGSSKWLRVVWVGGRESHQWLHYLSALEQWAKSIGCVRSVVIGRPGWERKLKDYKRTAIILEKVI